MLAGLMGISAVDNTNNTLSETTDVAAINDLNIAPELSSFSKAPPSPPAAADLPAPAFSFADAKLVNGNQAELTFTHGTSWLFHTAWLHDSCRSDVLLRQFYMPTPVDTCPSNRNARPVLGIGFRLVQHSPCECVGARRTVV
jgi:hypothetical protein